MPTIICSYCQYVGSGHSPEDRFKDAEIHEQTCKENPDYQEDEYELCEIFVEECHLHFNIGTQRHAIHQAPDDPNFAGFLYEDGVMDKESVRYHDVNGNELRGVNFETLKLGGIFVVRPYPNGHVVFKKQG